ncbi:MAG: hypothetical protein KAJ69_04940, partial [Thermoplasmatales archaeon]|nr:hypothetical protein [Thermoplasmatales archaeon]
MLGIKMEKRAKNKKRKNFLFLKNKKLLTLITISLIIILLSSICSVVFYLESRPKEEEEGGIDENEIIDDTISPLGVNQAVSLEIRRIHKKGIENVMRKIGNSWKEKPIYHFVAVLDDAEWIGENIDKWDTGYVGWETFRFVEDEQEECTIELKIFETTKKLFRNYDQEMEVFQVTYDFRNGRWTGDDNFNDSDGYGHFNGENYEIWFDVHQLDEDGDGIPYWWEVNKLHTDPKMDDSKLDPDEDDISTAWEWKWGYDPFVYDNHSTIDPEKDGLSNLEEYNLK